MKINYKLAIVTPSIYVPGYMSYIDNQVDGIKKFDLTVFTLNQGKNVKNRVVNLSDKTKLEKIINRALGVIHYFRKTSYWENRDFFIYNNLYKYLMTNAYDLVLVHFLGIGISFLKILKMLQVPIVVVCHESEFSEYIKIDSYRKKIIELFNIATIFLCVSEYMKNLIIKNGCPAHKIFVLYLGVERQKIKSYEARSSIVSFVSTGRLVPIKNFDMLLTAFSKIRDENIILRVIGDGPLMHQLSSKYSFNKKIIFCGHLDNAKVKNILNNSDVYIQSSKNENLPISILEAMSFGLPAISTNVGGISEIIKNNKTGFLVSKEDVNGMARCILELSRNRELREKFGQASYDFVFKNFNLERQNEILENLLTNLIDRGKEQSSG